MPGCIGFDQVLHHLRQTGHAKAVLAKVATYAAPLTGHQATESEIDAAVHGAAQAAALFRLSPAQMSGAMQAVSHLVDADLMADVVPGPDVLPGAFELCDLGTVQVARPQAERVEVAEGSGVFRGQPISEMSDAEAGRNIALAELFNRVGDSFGAAPIALTYRGQPIHSVRDLLRGLEASGHDISVVAKSRIANFADLSFARADGGFDDVPAALLVTTPEPKAMVAAPHAELVLSVSGPDVNASLKWYMGLNGIEAAPTGIYRVPSWLGLRTDQVFSTDQGIEAMQLAHRLQSVTRAAAKEHGLALQGYGPAGVCNDSVAIIRQAVSGQKGLFPLLMQDQVLIPALQAQCTGAQAQSEGATEAQTLLDAVLAVPNDLKADAPHWSERALASITCADGEEIFDFQVATRQALPA